MSRITKTRTIVQVINWEVPLDLSEDEAHEAIFAEFKDADEERPASVSFWEFRDADPLYDEEEKATTTEPPPWNRCPYVWIVDGQERPCKRTGTHRHNGIVFHIAEVKA